MLVAVLRSFGLTSVGILTALGLAQPKSLAQVGTEVSITGVWQTSEGEMTFSQTSSDVRATYTQDNGRIQGDLAGNVLTGVWIENGSNQRCDRAIDGSFHWGRIEYVFTGDSFEGLWSYCDDEPTRSWTGERSTVVGNLPTPIPQVNILGTWQTSEGEMTFTQTSPAVLATYTQDSGRIQGTLNGNILTGVWIEAGSNQRCDRAIDDSFHWGRIEYVFTGDSFEGFWSYCDDEPTRSWTGERSTVVGNLPTPIPQVNILGAWQTSEGQMTFTQTSPSVLATYTQDNGRIQGDLAGNVLTGVWIENGSNQRCDRAIDGSFHWGRIEYVFTGDSFEGLWSYCDNEPTRSWTGTR